MNYGLYSAFLGMRARQRTLEAIANNIANAATSGFKAERLFHHSIERAEAALLRSRPVIRSNAEGQTIEETPVNPSADVAASADANDSLSRVFGIMSGGATDFATGVMRETGRPLDVALDGDGFLVVQTPRGERYTRAGALTLDAAGQLVTQRGELIVGENGPITIRQGKGDLSIGVDGSISVDGKPVGKMKVVRFENPRAALQKEGDSLFATKDNAQPQSTSNTRVVQGVLELSNVNAVTEMATMLHNSREFDSLQRSITLMMNDIGRKVATEI
ncbi:MAG TPA: flagellar basal-body rod protein FlgF, partial [Blastocatellia bacterium]|nr:flagellar basal-body rod protein FlgF [Blastocatellia bacterium]